MTNTELTTKLEALRELIQKEHTAYMQSNYTCVALDYTEANEQHRVTVKPGIKYTKVDVGHSGVYMVENTTGDIYSIKAYGVIHRGHQYGNLDTINNYYWGGYRAGLKKQGNIKFANNTIGYIKATS